MTISTKSTATATTASSTKREGDNPQFNGSATLFQSNSIGNINLLRKSLNDEMFLNLKNVHSTTETICNNCTKNPSTTNSMPINMNNPFLNDTIRRDEHQKTAMKICLVVSPPSNKSLQVN